jgi:hypothetical protein
MADLHFTVSNGEATTEMPLAGELDHLPDQQQQQQSAAAGGTATIDYIQNKLKQSSHPSVIIFHMLFKGLALFFYIFGGWFTGNKSSDHGGSQFIILTVWLILLLAADFWVVKNVTGRFLVGLRWWNKVDNDSTTWIFETAEQQAINPFDRSVFWTVLYLTPLLWVALLLFAVFSFKFNWLMICGIALSLSGANVYGYYRCSSDQKVKFQRMMQDGAQRGAMAVMRTSVLSALTGNPGSAAGR